MSKADEIFEKLGYEKMLDNDTETLYRLEERLMGDKCTHNLLFAKVGKIVFSYGAERHEVIGVGTQELQAINEKVKELKWI